MGAWTTTTPVGKVIPGKIQHRKDLTTIFADHDIPYAAQVAPHAWRDLMRKVRKAVATDGPSFINALSPCPRGWRYYEGETIAISRLAVETCMWPLYEVEDGNWRLSYKPAQRKPVTDWLRSQGRFAHLFRPENKHIIDELQGWVDREWDKLLKRCAG
jgi:pyruvate ferredoxin oxidoreductase beta subunit